MRLTISIVGLLILLSSIAIFANKNSATGQLSQNIVVTSGSLKTNIERIAKAYGWPQVIWKGSHDYRWVGTTQIHASTLAGALGKLLENYPLQARLYCGNHILVVVPRAL